MKRRLTPAEVEDQLASMIAAAGAADHKRFEAQLELGAILIQLQSLRTAYRAISKRLDRTFEEIVEHDFMIDVTRGYQFIKFRKIDEVLRKAGEPPLKREGQARVVGPLAAYPDKLVRVVKEAREAAESEGKGLADRHLTDARRALAPESYRGAIETHGESGTPDTPWPWSEDARDQFGKVPKRFKADMLESLTFTSLTEEVTPETVDEALVVVRGERDAPTGRKGWPVVVGVAVAVVQHNRRQLVGNDHPELLDSGLSHEPIADLDILADDYLVPVDADGYTPAPSASRAPLLVVIPACLCPDALFDAHPGAREKAEGRAEVIVEVGELEAFGGSFLDTLDEHGHRMLDIQRIREASRAAGIEKKLHPAGPGIEWAKWAVNCCTGCSHGCSRRFCYASDFALLYFPQAFVPTIWPARLDAFANTDPPDPDGYEEHERVWCRTAFHGSMTDIMNTAFPNYWVQAVIDAIAGSTKWRVVVLTKLATRLPNFTWPKNAVVGVTVTGPKEVRAAAKALGSLKGEVQKWISAEPYFEFFDPAPLIEAGVRLIACGAQTATRWAGEIQPKAKDVNKLWLAVLLGGAHFFPKNNLDHRGNIPDWGHDPYAGWSPPTVDQTTDNGPEPKRDKAAARRPVRPKGPPAATSP